jgi:hypothetical protein
MPDSDPTTSRPWQVLADDVCREQDAVKLRRLIAELNEAMEEQGVGRAHGRSKTSGKVKPDSAA